MTHISTESQRWQNGTKLPVRYCLVFLYAIYLPNLQTMLILTQDFLEDNATSANLFCMLDIDV